MATFDLASLVRGISGGITGGLKGKQEAEDRRRKQQSQAVADLLSKSRAGELQDRGRRAREARQAREDRAAADKAALEQGQRQRADFILSNLGAADLEGIKGFESQTLSDQLKSLETALKRQRSKADRVPRKPPRDPEEVAAEKREKAIISERGRILRDNPEMSESEAITTATRRIDEQKFLFESQGLMQRLDESGGRAIHLGGDQQDKGPSVGEIEQMIRDLAAQGLSPEEIQANLAQRGINVRL